MIQRIKANRIKAIILAVIALSVLLRFININAPLENDRHNFRGTQTAFIVKSMQNNGFSLSEFEIPVFGEPWDTVYMEYPVYQILVYLLMKLFHGGSIDMWCRITDIIAFYLSAGSLFLFAAKEAGKRAAVIAVLFYVLLPYDIYWSRTAMIEFTAVLFAVSYCYGITSWMRKPGWLFFIFALVCGSMAYLAKSTTMFVYVYFLAFYIPCLLFAEYKKENGSASVKGAIHYYSGRWRYILQLGLLCVLPVIPGVMWTRYADMKKMQNPHTVFMTSSAIKAWNFGSLQMRLDPGVWKALTEQYTGFLLGGGTFFIMLAVLVFLLGSRRYMGLIISALAASFLAMFTLINLYLEHDYYQTATAPVACIALGAMLYDVIFSNKFTEHDGIFRNAILALLGIALIAGMYRDSGFYFKELLRESKVNNDAGLLIKEITDPDERILVDGEDWSSRVLYYADRKGFMNRDPYTGSFSGYCLDNVHLGSEYTTLLTRNGSFLTDIDAYTDIGVQYLWDDSSWAYSTGDPEATWVIARMMPENELEKMISETQTAIIGAGAGTTSLQPENGLIRIRHKKADTTTAANVVVTFDDGSSIEHKVYFLPGTADTLIDTSLIDNRIAGINVMYQ